jgi:hypothetical protein
MTGDFESLVFKKVADFTMGAVLLIRKFRVRPDLAPNTDASAASFEESAHGDENTSWFNSRNDPSSVSSAVSTYVWTSSISIVDRVIFIS